jgi:hypothetical protein
LLKKDFLPKVSLQSYRDKCGIEAVPQLKCEIGERKKDLPLPAGRLQRIAAAASAGQAEPMLIIVCNPQPQKIKRNKKASIIGSLFKILKLILLLYQPSKMLNRTHQL